MIKLKRGTKKTLKSIVFVVKDYESGWVLVRIPSLATEVIVTKSSLK